jgi:hypothetical protein
VFIVDDTLYSRECSKKVELLSWGNTLNTRHKDESGSTWRLRNSRTNRLLDVQLIFMVISKTT